jgi:hypothetical protein
MFPDDVTGCKESGTSNGTEISFDDFNPLCSSVSFVEVLKTLEIFLMMAITSPCQI